jgi:FkbM family methyltransferase
MGARAAAHCSARLTPKVTVHTALGELQFWCPTAASATRATNFNRKEPETRHWIDTYVRPGEHLWDVGANVGGYSLYACLISGVTVTAFEPMAANFAVLVKNIALNDLSDRITPLCVALTNEDSVAPFHLSDAAAGSAMHALGKPENAKGVFHAVDKQTVVAARGSTLVTIFGLHSPDHVKIDVDGHERQVLEGMRDLLRETLTICIEIADAPSQTRDHESVETYLNALGYTEAPLDATWGNKNRLFVNRGKRSPTQDRLNTGSKAGASLI